MIIYKSGKYLIAETRINGKKIVTYVNRHQSSEEELRRLHKEAINKLNQ